MKSEEFFTGNNPSREDIKRITDYIHSIKNENRRRNAYSCAENILRNVRLGGYRDLHEVLMPNDNTLSMKIFEILIGVKLHRTQKRRMQQLEAMFPDEHAKFLKKLEEAERKRLLEEEHERKNKVYNELKDTKILSDDGRIISRLQDFWELYCKGWRVGRKFRGAVARYIFSSPDEHAYILIDAGVADYLQSENFILPPDAHAY